ncbi:MAG: hypothetical protein ACYTFH_07420 [Planctomycetota bacterium]|jgi:hypothetical protein
MELRRFAAGIVLLSPLALVACGGEDSRSAEGPPAVEGDAATASDEPSNTVAAPGSGFGLGSSAGGGGNGGTGGESSRREAPRASGGTGGTGGTSTATTSSGGTAGALPEPPASAIEVPQAAKDPETFFKNVDDLDRDASDPKYAEFRELCARNTDLLVRLARARKAMRDGGVREEEAYLAIDGQYAEFTEQMGNYMAQRRWNDRDREVMGLLMTRSNEEALNRVRTGS